jgi:hypothetical protein
LVVTVAKWSDPQNAVACQVEVGGVGGVGLDFSSAPRIGTACISCSRVDDLVGRAGQAICTTFEVITPRK